MNDICRCEGDNCPIRKSCYRYTLTAEEHQCYMISPPFKIVNDNHVECDFYIKDKTNE